MTLSASGSGVVIYFLKVLILLYQNITLSKVLQYLFFWLKVAMIPVAYAKVSSSAVLPTYATKLGQY